MKSVTINHFIIADPAICHGQPVFKGTRIMVWQVLELLESGQSAQEIIKDYPSLSEESITAALHYATEKVKETSYVPFTFDPQEQSYISA